MSTMEIKTKPSREIMQDAEKLAAWLNQALSSEALKARLGTEFATNRRIQAGLGNHLINYAIATRDFSTQGFEKLLSKFNEESTGKHIATYLKETMTIPSQANNIEIMEYILAEVEKNCYDLGFATHTFNAALIDAIDKDGLDSSKEMFQEHFETLTPYAKIYKTSLRLTAASNTTFDYANDSPERFMMTVLSSYLDRESGETTEQYYKRRFNRGLEQETFNAEDKARIKKAGTELIEFYGQPKTAGVAIIPNMIFFEQSNEPRKRNDKMYIKIVGAACLAKDSELALSPTLREKLKEFNEMEWTITRKLWHADTPELEIQELRQKLQETAKKLFQGIEVESNNNGQRQAFTNLINKAFYECVEWQTCINGGNGIGVKVDGNKIPRENFVIAEIPLADELTCEKFKHKEKQSNTVTDKSQH